jgi:hypothetical protein
MDVPFPIDAIDVAMSSSANTIPFTRTAMHNDGTFSLPLSLLLFV